MWSCFRFVASCASVLWLSLGAAFAQSDDSARVEKLGDGVYAILHDDATDEWPHSNTGVVISNEGVLVVDATYLPSRARKDIALIRTLTDQPVRYLVYTHWHFDHNNGAIAYYEAFPNITIIAEREMARFIELNQVWWSKMSTAADSQRRQNLAKLKEEVQKGVDEAGHKLTDAEIKRRASFIPKRENELEELRTLEVVKPNKVFDGELMLELGGRKIEIKNWGKANSPDDVTIYLPKEKILFAGDIIVESPLPYVGMSWPLPWIKVLHEIEGIKITAMMPGHGPVMHDHSYTRQVLNFLETAVSRVETMIREGKTLDQIQPAISLEDTRADFEPWRKDVPEEDWKYNVTTIVERAWRGLRGQG